MGDASSTLEGQAAAVVWTDLIHESQVHCMAGLLGSTCHVGIVGYKMGGGFGRLGTATEAEAVGASVLGGNAKRLYRL